MTKTINLKSWQDQAVNRLVNSETPNLEVQVITALALKKSREWVIAHPEEILDSRKIMQLDAMLSRLLAGEPLAYITGIRSFFGMDFHVSPEVLIPRPETELLVEEALAWLEANPLRRNAADVGTGSGVIAISMADTIADLHVTAFDISSKALEIAKINVEEHGLSSQIDLLQNDLLDGVRQKFDLVTANLPYIPTSTLGKLDSLKFEPHLALDGGEDGLFFIKRLLEQAKSRLNYGGLILIEIEATCDESTMELAAKLFPQSKIDLVFDYANLPRLVKIQS